MDEDDDLTFEQIKKLQEQRKKNGGLKVGDDYNSEIIVPKSSTSVNRSSPSSTTKKSTKKRTIDDEDDYQQSYRKSIRDEFDSYTAPKHIFDTIPIDPNDEDPLKEYRKKTVAEQETEYQSRWRKRGLSPPRDYDPFTGKGGVKGRSYRDIMIENQLAKEEKDLMLKIEQKKKDQLTTQRKERREEEILKEASKKKKVFHDNSSSSSSSSSSSTHVTVSTKWFIKVYKGNDLQCNPIQIPSPSPSSSSSKQALTFGRDSKNMVILEHPSCSSNHASITIVKEGKRPVLIDLKSTNQTLLNGQVIEPYHPNELYEGDIIKFGASTREYVVHHS